MLPPARTLRDPEAEINSLLIICYETEEEVSAGRRFPSADTEILCISAGFMRPPVTSLWTFLPRTTVSLNPDRPNDAACD